MNLLQGDEKTIHMEFKQDRPIGQSSESILDK